MGEREKNSTHLLSIAILCNLIRTPRDPIKPKYKLGGVSAVKIVVSEWYKITCKEVNHADLSGLCCGAQQGYTTKKIVIDDCGQL
uniref:SCP domain-containing protein n=1 Tax=Heterorhabditis bacteriophora TaxID=37862 RepID=A0A1I7XL41_HETBA